MAVMTYAGIADLKPRIQKTDDSDDAWLSELLEAAALLINQFCNREDGFKAVTTATAKYYMGSGLAHQLIDECVSITEVAVKSSASDATYTAWDTPTTNLAGDGDWVAYSGFSRAPDFNGLPFTSLQVDVNGDHVVFTGGKFGGLRGFRPSQATARYVPTVRVTALWGYSVDTPRTIKEACLMQSARWYKRFQSSMADSLATGDFGTLTFQRVLDPDIELILQSGRYVYPAIGLR